MGMGADGHMRFPRTGGLNLRDENGKRITLFQQYKMKQELGIIPRGYDRLTKRQKRIARLVVDGMSVKDACRKTGVNSNTYFRWMAYHKKFKKFYLAYAEQVSGLSEARLKAKVPRAVRIIEESMESGDPYFKHDVAHKHLVGLGYYKKHGEQNKNVSMVAKIDSKSKITHEGKPLDRELVTLFVEAMAGMTSGTKLIKPKIIDVTEVKVLPGSSASGANEAESEDEKVAAKA